MNVGNRFLDSFDRRKRDKIQASRSPYNVKHVRRDCIKFIFNIKISVTMNGNSKYISTLRQFISARQFF